MRVYGQKFNRGSNTISLLAELPEQPLEYITVPFSKNLAKALKKGASQSKGRPFDVVAEGEEGDGKKGGDKKGDKKGKGDSMSLESQGYIVLPVGPILPEKIQ